MEGEKSNSQDKYTVGQKIWGLKILNSSKIFIWKAVKESLPTKKNIFKRKLTGDALCPIYGSQEELLSMPFGVARLLQMCGLAPTILCKSGGAEREIFWIFGKIWLTIYK